MSEINPIFLAAVLLGAILLAIYHNKKNQKKIMRYYEEGNQEATGRLSKSLENQEKMIELLEQISKKLDK